MKFISGGIIMGNTLMKWFLAMLCYFIVWMWASFLAFKFIVPTWAVVPAIITSLAALIIGSVAIDMYIIE